MNWGSGSGVKVFSAPLLGLLALSLILPVIGCVTSTDTEGAGNKKSKPTLRKHDPNRIRSAGTTPTVKRSDTDPRSARERRPSGMSFVDMRRQEALIEGLRDDLAARDQEIADLKARLEGMPPTTDADAAAKIQELTGELDIALEDLTNQTRLHEEENSTYEAEIQKLQEQLSAMAGAPGGIDVNALIEENESNGLRIEMLTAQVEASQRIQDETEKSLDELKKEKAGWNDQEKALTEARDAAQGEVTLLLAEKKGLQRQLDLAIADAALAQDGAKVAGEVKQQLDIVQGSANAAKDSADKALKDVKKAQAVALVAFVGAIVLGILGFWFHRNLKYQVAVAQATSGGIEPAEVEQIVSAQVSELAGSLQTMGTSPDVEKTVATNVKKELGVALQSPNFQKQMQDLVARSAPKGGGGGGLSSQEVKVMVDNQFRAITTYLKNEAVPKMVEDALKKKKG